MAIETLRPSGVGDETNIAEVQGAATHWEAVDEVSADGTTTIVRTPSAAFERDLYSLTASGKSGPITSIKIYILCEGGYASQAGKISLKSNSTVTDGNEVDLSAVFPFQSFSQQWNTNPADSQPWGSDWAVIDALQIGVSLRGGGTYKVLCTQVYVEIDYIPEEGGAQYITMNPFGINIIRAGG